jgi:hypothetical protein
LDLIKAGQLQLKKVDRSQLLPPPPPPPKHGEEDSSQLTLQDIMQKMTSIREAVANNESESTGEKLESTAGYNLFW